MISSRDPAPEGAKSRIGRWTYLPVKCGGSARAFLAGHPAGVWCHWDHGSKPCKKKMTDARFPCMYCSAGMSPTWRGFTPVYDSEYVQRFVCVAEEHLESVREIRRHELVVITRGKRATEPAVIRPERWRLTALPEAAGRAWPVDLLPYLVRCVWKDADLINFASDNAPSLVDAAGGGPVPAGDAVAAVLNSFGAGGAGGAGDGAAGDPQWDAVKNRLKEKGAKLGTNGRHDK